MSHTTTRAVNRPRIGLSTDLGLYVLELTTTHDRRGIYNIFGSLSGTVQKLTNFVRKRVNIYLEVSGGERGFAAYLIHIDSQWSDPTTGTWEFTRLNPNERYTIIIYDHLNEYDPIIRVGLQPEVE